MKRLALFIFIMFIAFSATAKEVTLVAGLSLPPYIIQESNSGMEYDIIKEALAKKGHVLKIKYVPFVRVAVDYKKVDGAVTINESSGIKGNYSNDVMTYKNYAISLKKNSVKVNSIKDLKDKKIVAFQNATKYLGPLYAKTVKSNPKYSEIAKQVLQVKLLYSGRTDLIVSDINIFKFYKKKVKGMKTTAKIKLHELFKGVKYKVLFNDASIRNDFNAGLKMLRKSGRYNAIIKKYVK
ncbi:MAG: ABC transporter substrate-binding protein [Deltaproteobacteria bacterium]|nr:ABC transporter substrate-binding protein [Deltaproteobacteria bacterium]